MATSSSDESSIGVTKEREFQISSSSDSGSRISCYPTIKCQLCNNSRKVFHCKDCVNIGLFYHSKHSIVDESYLDKKRILLELEEGRKLIERKCLQRLENKLKADVLRSKIRQCRDRNRIYKLAVEEKAQRHTKLMSELKKLSQDVRTNEEKLSKYDVQVIKVANRAADKIDKIKELQKKLDKNFEEIKRLVKIRITQLKYVFPITRVEPKLESESSESEVISALAEASQTMYIKDRWEYTDYSGELQYSIVEPTLPGSGNYSLYNLWVSQNKDAVPVNTNQDLIEHNQAYNISAALSHTAQLIHVLAFYLNIRLPYRMVYSDFCGTYMDESQFTRRVNRLNANILHLCSTQNIDLSTLKACETIPNLLKLIDISNPHLGRQGPIEIDNDTAETLEESLNRDLEGSGENTDTDEGDNFHKEWETVPHIPCQENSLTPGPIISTQMITTQQATSMAGGLVNSAAASIASMWRGFTGR